MARPSELMALDEALHIVHAMGREPGRTLRQLMAIDTLVAGVRRLEGEAAERHELRWRLGIEDDDS